MTGRGSRVGAGRLLCAAGCGALFAVPAWAKQRPSSKLPPTSSEPSRARSECTARALPDLGVDWPQLDAKEAGTRDRSPGSEAPKAAADLTTEASGTIRYTWLVEGLSPLGGAQDLLAAFRKQSTLEAERKEPANAAQIGRRASADADLLTQLLRSQGYYDAAVEPSTDRSGRHAAGDPDCRSGRTISLRLGRAARASMRPGRMPRSCATVFAVKAGDPVIART